MGALMSFYEVIISERHITYPWLEGFLIRWEAITPMILTAVTINTGDACLCIDDEKWGFLMISE